MPCNDQTRATISNMGFDANGVAGVAMSFPRDACIDLENVSVSGATQTGIEFRDK
jgi:hypothetical protein